VTNAVLIERTVSCWHLHQLISQTTHYLDSWLSDLFQSELKLKLLGGGARALVSHSWRRHWSFYVLPKFGKIQPTHSWDLCGDWGPLKLDGENWLIIIARLCLNWLVHSGYRKPWNCENSLHITSKMADSTQIGNIETTPRRTVRFRWNFLSGCMTIIHLQRNPKRRWTDDVKDCQEEQWWNVETVGERQEVVESSLHWCMK